MTPEKHKDRKLFGTGVPKDPYLSKLVGTPSGVLGHMD